jgi:putative acetyltransferase
MMDQVAIRAERPDGAAGIFALHQAAFASPAEPRLVSALRDGGYSRVSLVAERTDSGGPLPADGPSVVGHILFSALRIAAGNGSRPALALAPLAVLPAFQRQGIGSALIREGLAACRGAGHDAVFVVGHLDYYPRFGFSAQLAARFECDYSGQHFMALELRPGALSGARGRVEYSSPFRNL